MGLHAFDAEPGHCALYRRALGDALPPLRGLGDRWNVLTAEFDATLPEGSVFPGVDHYVLTVQTNDAPVRRIDDPRFSAVAGRNSLSLQRPGSGGSFVSDGPVRYAHLYFQQSLLCELGDSLGLGTDAELEDVFALNDAHTAKHVLDYVGRAADLEDRPSAIEMDSRGYLIAVELLRRVNAHAGDEPRPAHSLPPARLRRVMELIDNELASQLRLSHLGDEAGLSPFHFARAFKQTTGVTPAAYIMRRRVERAVEAIEGTNLSLAEIAHRFGFANQSHMTRKVKERRGETPGALRAKRR